MSNDIIANTKKRETRPPVVVVLGHVDHGKTTILDTIRKTKVADKEAGGITQHIGAYQINHQGKNITFIDTPGHEAFSAIRSRGARVADIAVLVVAADEGVKPQTKEAIQIIKASETPFIVAINKIDKEGANPSKVKQELAEIEVLVEDYGGKIPVVEVSARTGEGMDSLLEIIVLSAEVENLTWSSEALGKGIVIESHLDPRKGIVATLLVLDGSLIIGQYVATASTQAKIKTIEDFTVKAIKSAIASDPIVVLGWESMPAVGEEFESFNSLEEAKKYSLAHSTLNRPALFIRESGPELSNKKILNLIIKADTLSSLEALDKILSAIHSEEIEYRVISYGAGKIGDDDVKSAIASKAVVIGFNVIVDDAAKQAAERRGITFKTFNIIYELVEFVRQAMSDLLDPEISRISLGKLKVLRVFKKETRSQIIGGRVISGKIVRGAMADIIRGNNTLLSGKIGQLQNKKSDVTEVAEGFEAGIRFDMNGPIRDIPVIIKEGDVLDVYQEEKIKRSI